MYCSLTSPLYTSRPMSLNLEPKIQKKASKSTIPQPKTEAQEPPQLNTAHPLPDASRCSYSIPPLQQRTANATHRTRANPKRGSRHKSNIDSFLFALRHAMQVRDIGIPIPRINSKPYLPTYLASQPASIHENNNPKEGNPP